jgi:hypothetical protein
MESANAIGNNENESGNEIQVGSILMGRDKICKKRALGDYGFGLDNAVRDGSLRLR